MCALRLGHSLVPHLGLVDGFGLHSSTLRQKSGDLRQAMSQPLIANDALSAIRQQTSDPAETGGG